MKKLIVSGCAVLATVAALATTTVESANTFGVLKVADNTQKEIIVGIPWEAVGGDDINVTDLVLAAGLETGDTILWYNKNTNKYQGWKINSSGAWEAIANTVTITKDSTDTFETADATKTLARGNAILIQRANPESTIYLSGQYNSAAATKLTIPGPEQDTAAYFQVWTPIASPKAEEWDLNDETTATWGNVGPTDKIIIGPGEEFVRYDSKWAKVGSKEVDYRGSKSTVTTYSVDEAKIPVGRGGWYIREGKGNATLTWQ